MFLCVYYITKQSPQTHKIRHLNAFYPLKNKSFFSISIDEIFIRMKLSRELLI
ncbi:hypothetical protein HCCG_00439 [Helicobacter cinaedi CCUG 18818 = ATCC BAA-847]|uniref:Uncharacterized protein n=1 Tax=Helicobacter cinaedi CCUG 18818 = ATCC BAA-847 TaxID=537971 RepID=A0ABN0B8R5_9HELI|nr:hypothetical protein HCCG_00439 [Helicobacter cinaedi CCUG 18818 = ATCC BAA-847]BBB20996.1 hypothetical protein HC081234_21730 [Helicobacter cinaedi]